MPRKTLIAFRIALGILDASMRPRPDAAENGGKFVWTTSSPEASMRPRPDAAENTPPGSGPSANPRCFNEAAARCRGKPGGASRP